MTGVSATLDEFSELLDALDDLGAGRGVIEGVTLRGEEGATFRVRGATGNALIQMGVRARRDEGRQARVSVNVDERGVDDRLAERIRWMATKAFGEIGSVLVPSATGGKWCSCGVELDSTDRG